MATEPIQNIGRKRAVINACFNQLDLAFWTIVGQPFGQLKGEQFAEKRTGGRTGKKVPFAANPSRLLVISQARSVKRRVHKLGKSDRAGGNYQALKQI